MDKIAENLFTSSEQDRLRNLNPPLPEGRPGPSLTGPSLYRKNDDIDGLYGSNFPTPPETYGDEPLSAKDEDSLRLKRKDLRNNASIDLTLRHLNRFHKAQGSKYTEDALRQGLLLITPDRILEFLDPLVEERAPLCEIYEALFQAFGKAKSTKVLRYELSSLVDNTEDDPLTVLQKIGKLLQGSPGSMREMDSLCLFEAQRFVGRVAGEVVAGGLDGKFQSSPRRSFMTYLYIAQQYYSKSLQNCSKPGKKALNHLSDSDLLGDFDPRDILDPYPRGFRADYLSPNPGRPGDKSEVQVLAAALSGFVSGMNQINLAAVQPPYQPPLPAPITPTPLQPPQGPAPRPQYNGIRPGLQCYNCGGPHYRSGCPVGPNPGNSGFPAPAPQYNPPLTMTSPADFQLPCPLHGGHQVRSCRTLLSRPCPLPKHGNHPLSACLSLHQPRYPGQNMNMNQNPFPSPPNYSYPQGYPTQPYLAPPMTFQNPFPPPAPRAPVVGYGAPGGPRANVHPISGHDPNHPPWLQGAALDDSEDK